MPSEQELKYDIFLSHNSSAKPSVEAIGTRLRKEGFRPFLDKWNLVPGMPWQQALSDALDQSGCTAIFFDDSGDGAWHNQELQIALNKAARTRDDYRVIPVLLPGAEPAQIGAFLGLRTWVDFRPGIDDDIAFRRLVAAIQGVAPDDTTDELPDEPRPYRGLQRFEGDQHEFFYGRDEEIRRLLERLQNDSFAAVVGASGSGKSSLVRAGLCTDTAEAMVAGIRNFRRIVFVPGNDPLRQLAVQLVAHLPESERPALVRGFIEDFQRSSQGLITALGTLFPNAREPILLVVDQFEELFTQRPLDDQQHQAWHDRTACFAGNLRAAVEARTSWLQTIVTLRADFVDRFVGADFPDFRELLERRQFWLGEMTDENLREVIVFPARRRGAFFEKGLLEMILRDMRGQSSALPLLEEALATLWSSRRGPWLTIGAYESSGGVGGALASKAEGIYGNLSKAEQETARRIFLGLVQLGEGARDTRRRAEVGSLVALSDDPDRVNSVINRFSNPAVRLITVSSQESGAAETAEVTHEALFDHWAQLHSWLDEGRGDMRFQRRVEEAARNWDKQGRPDGSLWRRPDLDLLRQFVERSGEDMTPLQMDFFLFSDEAETARVAKEARQQARLRRLLRFSVAATLLTAILAIAATGSALWAHNQTKYAEQKRKESEQALGQGLAYGIGENASRLGLAEQDALWDLARLESDLSRVAFLETMLSTPQSAIRLRNRLDFSLHAAVGFNQELRRAAIALVLNKLDDPSIDHDVKMTCIDVGLQLREPNAEFATEADRRFPGLVAENLVKAMEDLSQDLLQDNSDEQQTLRRNLFATHASARVPSLALVLSQLESAQASKLSSRWGAAIRQGAAKMSPYQVPQLAATIIVLVEFLPSPLAESEISAMIQIIDTLNDDNLDERSKMSLLQSQSDLAAYANQEVARRIVDRMLTAYNMETSTDDYRKRILLESLVKLVGKMSDLQASQVVDLVASKISDPANPDADDIDRLAGIAYEYMREEDARRIAMLALRRSVQALAESNYAFTVISGSRPGEVSPPSLQQIESEQAVQLLDQVVTAADPQKPQQLVGLAEFLASLADHASQAHRQKQLREFSHRVETAVESVNSEPIELASLANCCRILADRAPLSLNARKELARRIAAGLETYLAVARAPDQSVEPKPDELAMLATGYTMVVAGMNRDDFKPVADKFITEILSLAKQVPELTIPGGYSRGQYQLQQDRAWAMWRLADALVHIAELQDVPQLSLLATEIAAMADEESVSPAFGTLTEAMLLVAKKMSTETARQHAQPLIDRILIETASDEPQMLDVTVAAYLQLVNVMESQAAQQTALALNDGFMRQVAMPSIGNGTSYQGFEAVLAYLNDRQLIETLKCPSCVDDLGSLNAPGNLFRRTVLDELQRRLGSDGSNEPPVFENLWAFQRWLQTHRSELSQVLLSPAARPQKRPGRVRFFSTTF